MLVIIFGRGKLAGQLTGAVTVRALASARHNRVATVAGASVGNVKEKVIGRWEDRKQYEKGEVCF